MGDRALSTSVTYNRDFSKITHYVYFLYPHAVPSRTIWRRPLMVRQPYSEAVPSSGGRLHPLSSLREERLGEKGGAFFNGKEGRDDFRTPFFI